MKPRVRIAVIIFFAVVAASAFAGIRNSRSCRGGGLTGEYYRGRNFEELAFKRVDSTVDLRRKLFGAVSGSGNENYSIRWTGGLRIDTAGEYTLWTLSDDGARLWIDGIEVVSSWNVCEGREQWSYAKLKLEEGVHPVRIEYFQADGAATMKFRWEGPASPQWNSVVPFDNLVPNAGPRE